MLRNGASQSARSTETSARARLARAGVAAVAVAALVLGALVQAPAEVAQAATSNSCAGLAADDQNSMRVTASHGKVFYIDSGAASNLDAAYLSYKVDNLSTTTARSNLWASVDTFTGGVVGLANPADAAQPLGDVAASSSRTAFFLLKATSSTTRAQSHVVHVYSGKPGTTGAVELYSCTFAFAKVSETIKAAANKVTGISTTAVTTIGSTMTITVEGNTGTIGSGNAIDGSMVWISPAARSTWPTGALRLESTTFTTYTNNSRNTATGTYSNQLRIPLASGAKYYYTAVYTFRITGISAVSSSTVVPIAQIASGTQIKHTDLSSISSATVTPGASTTSLAVTKAVSPTVDVADGYTTIDYTVTLANTGAAVSVDAVTDKRDAGLSFVPGSARYNGVAIRDPGLVVGSQNSLVFSGPFSVPLGSSGTPTLRTLTYKMTIATCASGGSFMYRNSATASIGMLSIGSTASTQSVARAGGDCGSTTLTTHETTDETLPVEVTTSPASAITTTAARVNGLVDPNGTSGQSIVFEVGTSATLAGATSTTVGTTTSATSAYAVYQDLTGLSSGTLFYFRVSVGGVQGDILSFVTPELAALPTATTTAATDVTTTSATINGSVDPNQVANGAKVKFQYAADSSSGACTTLGTVTTTAFLVSETETGTEPAILLGAFPADVSYGLTGLTPSAYYCYKVVAYYNATSAVWDTAVAASNWVAFRATVKTAQTITFATPGSTTAGSTLAAGGTTTSGLTISYSSNTPDVCSVTGTTITTLAAGTCSITAEQAGNDSYSAAAPVTVTFPVTKRTQAISFSLPSSATAGDLIVLTGTTNATGLSVSYTAGPSTVCSIDVDGKLQTGPDSGSCTVTASQAGNDAYLAASDVEQILTVNPGPPVIITTTLPDATIDSAYSETLAAAGGDGSYSDWTLVTGVMPQGLFFNSATGEIWGTPTTAGITPLTFTVLSASQTSVQRTVYLTVLKKSQTITASDFSRAYGSLPVTTGASSTSGLTLSFSSSDPGVATVSGGLVTPVGVGETTITASNAGDDEYLAAADVTFTVTITPVTLTVTAPSPSVTYGDAAPDYTPTITGFITGEDASALSTLPSCSSSYTSSSNAGSTPTVSCSGAVAPNYVFAYVSGSVSIAKKAQTITVTPNVLGEMLPESTATFTASSTSGLTVTVVATGECSWAAGVLTASALEGSCTVTASIAESTNYLAATDVVRTTEVKTTAKANRTIALELTVPGSTHSLVETLGGVTTLGPVSSPVVYSVTLGSAGVCTIDAATGAITLLGVGTCTIVSSVAGDADYNPAEAQLSFAVTIATRSLSLTATPGTAPVGDDMVLAASPSAGSGAITYSLISGSLYCSISGTVITGLAAGECDVQASIVAHGAYDAASSSVLRLTVTAVPAPSASPSPSPSSSGPSPAGPSTAPAAVTPPAPSPTPTPTSSSVPRVSPLSNSALTAAGRLPNPVLTTPSIGQPVAPGAPSYTGSSVDTVDFGQGIENADSATGDYTRAQRSEAALLGERFTGFAAGSGVIVQVTGARTIAQFAVTPGGVLSGLTITQAIDESRARLLADFAAADSSAIVAEPTSASVLGGTPTHDARLVFADAGLPDPITAGQLEVQSSQLWVTVSAHVDGYAPGSIVYLAVRTDPVIIGASVVSKTGSADLVGMVPADLLESGAHSLRVIGIRQLSGITAAEDGSVTISAAAMDQIQRFDVGTQATVRLVGANETGGSFQVVRIVPLTPDAPWWAVIALALLGLLLTLLVGLRRVRTRWMAAASALLAVGTLLPVIAGWLSRSYEVIGWGLIVAVLVQVLLWGSRRLARARDGRGRRSAQPEAA